MHSYHTSDYDSSSEFDTTSNTSSITIPTQPDTSLQDELPLDELPLDELPLAPPNSPVSEFAETGAVPEALSWPTGDEWLEELANQLEWLAAEIEDAENAGIESPSPVDHATAETDHASGDSQDVNNVEISGEPWTGVTSPEDDESANSPYHKAAQAFVAAAASEGIQLGPRGSGRSKSSSPAPESQQPAAGHTADSAGSGSHLGGLDPTSPSFTPSLRLNAKSPEFVPGRGQSSPNSEPYSPGEGLYPETALFQPGIAFRLGPQLLDQSTVAFDFEVEPLSPTTTALQASWEEWSQGEAYSGSSGEGSWVQDGTGTEGDVPWHWYSPELPSVEYDPSDGGAVAELTAQSYRDSTPELPPDPPRAEFRYPGEIPPGWQCAVMFNDDGETRYVLLEEEPQDGSEDDGDGDGAGLAEENRGTAAGSPDGAGFSEMASEHRPADGVGFSTEDQLASSNRPPNERESFVASSNSSQSGPSSNGSGSSRATDNGEPEPGSPRILPQPSPQGNDNREPGRSEGLPRPSSRADRNGGPGQDSRRRLRQPPFPLEGGLPAVRPPLPAIPEILYKEGSLPKRESRGCSNWGHRMACTHPGSRCPRCKRGRFV